MNQQPNNERGSVLAKLRDLVPQRRLQNYESLRIGELQANRLLELFNINDERISTELVSEGDEVFALETPGGFETPLFYGTVTRTELAPGATHWDIEVRPAIDPQSVRSVSIVRPIMNPKRMAN